MTARARKRHRTRRSSSPAKKVLLGAWRPGAADRHRNRQRRILGPQRDGVGAVARRAQAHQAGPDVVRLRLRWLASSARSSPTRSACRSSSTNIPKSLQVATIAIEDEHFYEHGGVDYQAIVRAAIENVEAGKVKQGGSTITQQLARNLYIADPEDDVERKLVEAKLAQELEDEHTKILDPAAVPQHRFLRHQRRPHRRRRPGRRAGLLHKSVATWSSPRRRCWPGLPQAPSDYNPFLSPEAASERRNLVLREMYEQGYITLAGGGACARHRTRPRARLPLRDDPRALLLQLRRAGADRQYGVNSVRQGGLKVYTTINPRLQDVARQAVTNGVAALGGPTGALVSTDPSTRQHRRDGVLRRVLRPQVQPRCPGASPARLLVQALRARGGDPRGHRPRHAPTTAAPARSDRHGPLRGALGRQQLERGRRAERSASPRRPRTRPTRSTPSSRSTSARRTSPTWPSRWGSRLPLDGYPAETIGGLRIGVSPLEMSNAYSDLRATAACTTRPRRSPRSSSPTARSDEPDPAEANRALTEGEAYEVTRVLETVVDSGTATAANYGCSDIAGKTGTTDDNTDAWFVGYTPNLSTAVWIGYPDSRTSLGSSAFGGTYSAPIWNEFMSQADPDCAELRVPDELPGPRAPSTATTPSPRRRRRRRRATLRRRPRRPATTRTRATMTTTGATPGGIQPTAGILSTSDASSR